VPHLYTARCQHSKEEAAALRAAIATSTAEAKTLAQRLKDSEAAAAQARSATASTNSSATADATAALQRALEAKDKEVAALSAELKGVQQKAADAAALQVQLFDYCSYVYTCAGFVQLRI
jgi:predicted RNase H-like nuclease (RuvC/YqgF family)